ncbi:MAG: AAA family ATPase [Halanaerobiaceae bacterium]
MSNKLKQIPVGIDDFKKIIERDAYFVDRTLFIKKIIENVSEVILFARPRRFGKTLNFSMIKCFLETPECRKLENQDKSYKYLFEGLDIYKEKELIENHLGKYPVINFSFKKIKANNWKDANYFFKEEISREYNRHSYLLDDNIVTPTGSRKKFERILNMEGCIIEYTSAIADLSRYLKKYYNKEVIVLIDEYDTPLHYAKLNGYYKEMLDIMRALMVDGMKGNKNLEKGIITGIMKISQESVFSSFNNPEVSTVIDSYCSDMFGFTENEVETLLEYYGLSTEMENVRKWYNGYLFGSDKIIYNPWSVLKFVKDADHKPKLYWINTGDPELIKRSLQLDQVQGKRYVEDLYNGKSIEVEVEQNIIYEDVFNNVEKALSFLLHSGYLKAEYVEDKVNTYKLSIPNREITQIYKNILENWFNRDQGTNDVIKDMINDLLSLEINKFKNDLASLLLTVSSYYDAASANSILKKTVEKEETDRYENFYHGLLLGLMVNMGDDYYLCSNQEFGKGRPDIVILPKDVNNFAFIMELKNEYTSSKKTTADAAQEALEQIKEKEYEQGVKKIGVAKVIKIGIGFKGKEVDIKWMN